MALPTFSLSLTDVSGPKLGKKLSSDAFCWISSPFLYEISAMVNEPGLAQLCPVVKPKVITI